ncbi:unnamed protein product [Urochloa humidicola]
MVTAMEHRTMQLFQAVLAPEASVEEEKVHLVLSMEDGHKLQQALQLVQPQRKIVLVHIHRPAMRIPIPTMGGTVHASILKDNIVKGYRDEQRDQALQALEGYKNICTRAEIQAETLMSENDNVSAGLLELIAEHKITTLIIIGIGKSWVNRSRRNLAAALQRGTDSSCNILFMHKGTLISASAQDGSMFGFETRGTLSDTSSRRHSFSGSSNSSPSPYYIWDSGSTPSSRLWDSRSPPDSLDPSQLDDPSLEIAGSIFGDSRLIVILGHESINNFRELTGDVNLVEYSHELHQLFQSKYSEIANRCQFIGGIDSVLGVSENCGEEYWKKIKAWPAAFEHIVRVVDTVLNIFECNRFAPEKILKAAKELIDRFLNVARAVTEEKKSPEKLFCTLYMCKAIVDSTPSLKKLFPAEFVSGVDSVRTLLNDFARGILRGFKELIQNYSSQKIAQDGSILLITGYVMKYIRLLINHSVSLDTILDYGQNRDLFFSNGHNDTSFEGISFTGHLEVEHSDIQLIVGAEWLKQRRDDFDMYMRVYISSTWEQQNFDDAFKETCNTQMHWKVPCPFLRSKLRDSILEHVTQAYKAYLETTRHSPMGVARNFKSKVNELFEG